MPKRKSTEAPTSRVVTAPAETPAPVTASERKTALVVTDASRRESAVAGLHRYFRGQEDRQQPRRKDAWALRPTMAIAEMIVLIRTITSSLEECRYADLLPAIRAVDADGCNWDMPSWDGDHERCADCRALVSGAIENLRARYNLA